MNKVTVSAPKLSGFLSTSDLKPGDIGLTSYTKEPVMRLESGGVV